MPNEGTSAGGYRPHDLLTLQQAAAEFNLSLRHLKTLRKERRVRSYVVGQRMRFRWIDLNDYVESCATPAAGRRK
jgi:excisionase family DNA binding protein